MQQENSRVPLLHLPLLFSKLGLSLLFLTAPRHLSFTPREVLLPRYRRSKVGVEGGVGDGGVPGVVVVGAGGQGGVEQENDRRAYGITNEIKFQRKIATIL